MWESKLGLWELGKIKTRNKKHTQKKIEDESMKKKCILEIMVHYKRNHADP